VARVDERPNDLPHCAHLYERSAATSRRPGDDVIDDVAGDAADDDGTLAATEAESTDDGDDDSEAGREMAEEAEDTAAAAATTCSYGFQMREDSCVGRSRFELRSFPQQSRRRSSSLCEK